MGDLRPIHQGDVYWLSLESDSDSRIPHPHVVIQEDKLNHDESIPTVLVCALTTNTKKLSYPGNVLLEFAEANLSRQSIVEVSKVLTIEKSQLGEYIGTLSGQRIKQILAGMSFVQRLFLNR